MIRLAAVAGRFYPADPGELERLVDRLLADGARTHGRTSRPAPAALVAPHAGYRYSGGVAGVAYATVARAEPRPERIVLAGPAHFVPLAGAAVPTAQAWATPLGEVPIDVELRAAALEAGCAPDDRPHAPEHALEVQLPFLQRSVGPQLTVLPVAIGPTPAQATAELLAILRATADLLVVSTDLSHGLDDATARRVDRATARAVTDRAPDRIADDAACGLYALRGLVELARRARFRVELLALRTSADATGDASRVVGYGAFAMDQVEG
jgi:AmmeMemoRadiSam system protein B